MYHYQVQKSASLINEALEELHDDDVTEAAIRRAKPEAPKKLADMPGKEQLEIQRLITVSYCGDEVQVGVSTLRQ